MHLCETCAVWTGAPPAISAISNSINNCDQRYLLGRRVQCGLAPRLAPIAVDSLDRMRRVRA